MTHQQESGHGTRTVTAPARGDARAPTTDPVHVSPRPTVPSRRPSRSRGACSSARLWTPAGAQEAEPAEVPPTTTPPPSLPVAEPPAAPPVEAPASKRPRSRCRRSRCRPPRRRHRRCARATRSTCPPCPCASCRSCPTGSSPAARPPTAPERPDRAPSRRRPPPDGSGTSPRTPTAHPGADAERHAEQQHAGPGVGAAPGADAAHGRRGRAPLVDRGVAGRSRHRARGRERQCRRGRALLDAALHAERGASALRAT